MAPRKRYIDSEWADSLVGLSMKVPDYWWKEYTTHNLNDGRIVSFDDASQKWHLLLNTLEDGDDLYPMAYAAVCEYSDKQSSSFQDFVLPVDPILEGGDEIDAGGTRYNRSTPDEWTQVQEGEGRLIDPIPWTGGDEEFSVNITDEEVDQLRDSSGEIRYEKVFRYCLPRFGDNDEETLFEFQAARMRNYMRKRVLEDNWTPKYYTGDRKISAGHVARYYGACMAKMIMGNRSIVQIFSTRDIFNAIPSIQASMTKNCLEDLTTCLHYSDDWECDGDWDLIYPDPKVEASYNFFCALYNKYHPGRKPMELKDCINNVTHSLLQEGDDIRQRSYGPPPSVTKDLSSSTSSDGRAIRSDAKNQPFASPTAGNGTGGSHAGTPRTPGSIQTPMGLYHQEVRFNKRKRDYISRVHQPMPCLVRGTGEKSGSGNHCRYKKCPGLNNKKKTRRAYTTIYQCEQCTVEKKRPMWLCHTTKKIDGKDTVVSCHLKYHAQKEFLKTTSSSECSLVSDLTEAETNSPNNDISSV